MPELPEVQTVAAELDRKLKHRTVKEVSVRAPKMVALGPGAVSNVRPADRRRAAEFARLLKGQKVISVRRRAKLLIFSFGGQLAMLVHLKMTGQFIFEDEKLRRKTGGYYRLVNKAGAARERLPSKHTHVIFYFEDGSVLYFNDVRKFGYLRAVAESEMGLISELKEFGPEPLSKAFTPELFEKVLKKAGRRKIKEALMDPRIVAGIGNIYSDEILYHARVRPDRPSDGISGREAGLIYKFIPIILKKAIKAKGSSVGDFVRTDGSWGRMGKFHFVYGRAGEQCENCGSLIQSAKVGGRTASFCPKCQK